MHERFENSERRRISKQRIAEDILLGSRCRYKKPGGQYKPTIRDMTMEILKKNYLSSIRLKYSSHVTPIKKIALKGESVWHGEAAIGIC